MSRMILLCGRICTGKSTYAERLRKELNAAVLSVDELTLALFGQDAGEMHGTYVERCEKFLFGKSLELAECGINVVFDFGLWTAEERRQARGFYAAHGIECEIHYIHVPDEEWHRRIEKRNADVLAGKTSAYYIDEGLAEKVARLFEPPTESEIDVRVK